MAIEQQLHSQQLETAKLQAVDLAATRERTLAAQGMLSVAGNAVGQAIVAPADNPSAREAVYDLFAKYPGLVSIPQGKELWDTFQVSEANAGDLQRQIAVAKAKPAITDTPDIRDAAHLSTLRKDAEAARVAGDTAKFQKIQGDIQDFLRITAKVSGQTIRAFDAQGNVTTEIISGATGGTATSAVQTAAQKKIIGYEIAVEGITDVLGKLTEADVGVKGWVGRNVFDTWVEQVRPGTRSTERIENQNALAMVSEAILESANSDTSGRMSDPDVKRLQVMSESLSASKNLGEVHDRLGNMRRLISSRARVWASRTGTPVPDFAKTEEELVAEFSERKAAILQDHKEHRLTDEQAQDEANKAHALIQSNIRRFYGPNAKSLAP